jgi:lipopolysaccharide export system protein LptA
MPRRNAIRTGCRALGRGWPGARVAGTAAGLLIAALAVIAPPARAQEVLNPPKQPASVQPQAAPALAPALPRQSLLADSLSLGGGGWHIMGARLSGSRGGLVSIDSLVARHGDLHLRALHGTWNPANRTVELDGEVYIEDARRALQGRKGVYLRDLGQLELDDEVQGRGPEGRFHADHLRYDRKREWLRLTGLVRLFEEHRSLRSDWLEYDLADSSATAGDDVLLRDEIDSLEARGGHLTYARDAGEMVITGSPTDRPRLVRGVGGEGPRLTVTADTLRLWTHTREGEALGRVEIDYGGARGSCDRTRFRMREERIALEGHPQLEDREGNVTGDSMVVEVRDGKADHILVWGHARSEYLPVAHPGEAHFAIGDTLTAYMSDGAMTSAVLSGGAQSLYLPARRDRDEGVGLNWTRGQRIRLVFGGEGVERVQFEGEVEGRYRLPYAQPGADASARDSLETAAAAVGDSLTLPAAAPPGDSLVVPSAVGRDVVAGEYAPRALAAIRALAQTGSLDPPDTLLARLPFDPLETVSYSGARIEFGVADDRIVMGGGSRVLYKGMELRSEEITFRSADRLITASGGPVLRDQDTQVDGVRMSYRIDNRMGLIYQGKSVLDPGIYRGERIKRVSERVFFVENGEFSSCEQDSPHYHFRAARMKIVPNEKVIARPVVMYIGHVPVFAIPYAVFPTRRGRHSGVLIPEVEFGFDTERGRFLRNIGYYWAASDYADGLVWMDYYEKDPRITWNARARYRVRYLLDGQVEGSYTRQRNYQGGRRDRWLLRLNHNQSLTDRWQFKVSGHFQSDKDYGEDRDFGANVDERVNRQLRSQASIGRSWSGASLSLLADRTEYLDNCAEGGSTVSQSAPSVAFSLSSLPLGQKPDARGHGGRRAWLSTTYLRGDARFLSIYERGCTGGSETNQAASFDVTLSDKRSLLGVLNLTPSAAIQGAWVAKGDEKNNPAGLAWRAGFSAGSTVYGTFFPRLGPWEGLRHVIELGASYSYRPELKHLEDFPTVGGITLGSRKGSSISLHLTQRFHAKWRAGEKSVKRENLLVWTTSTAYDFLAKERAREAKAVAHPWSDINHNLRLQPGRIFESDLSIGHDAERWRDEYSLSLRTSLRLRGGQSARAASEPGEDAFSGNGRFGDASEETRSGPVDAGSGSTGLTGPWQATLTHVYGRTRQKVLTERNTANLALGLNLTPAWRVQYGLYYDLDKRGVTSQSLTLVRDLHCWEAILERRESGGNSSYYFRISVKELPDIKYERRNL